MENNSVQIKVEGMTCGNCALSISKILERKGASHVAVNSASGAVSFTMAEGVAQEAYLDAIEDLGYKVQHSAQADSAHESHDHGDRSQLRLIICALLTIPLLAHMFSNWHVLHNPIVQLILATPVFIIGLITFLPSALRSLKNGLPNMNVLIMIGAIASYVYSLIGLLFFTDQVMNYLFFETTASIITLVMFGNWLEEKTEKSTTTAIRSLSELQPQKAQIVLTDSIGKETILEVDSAQIKSGDMLLVAEGMQIPVDGKIIKGEARIDEKMITGESESVLKTLEDAVVGGTMIVSGNIRIQATDVGTNSVLQRIIRMVQEAQGTKPRLQKLADKISAVFVPVVLMVAVLTFLVNYFLVPVPFTESMMRSIAVLVISCPCAMGLATPAAVAVGLGRAAKMGILVKGGDTLEQLKRIQQIVFDKTGTLTTGELSIGEVKIYEGSEENSKGIIASLEQHSQHPIAKSVYKQWQAFAATLQQVEEIKGKGMQGLDIDGNIWRLGSGKWLSNFNELEKGYDLYLMQNNTVMAALTITDELRPDALETITTLKKQGYKTILLSGDRKAKAMQVAEALGIDEVFAEYSPEEKHDKIAQLNKILPTAMVGDGINDAPALANATVGISLSKATQIAIQSAQIILSNDRLSSLPKALKLGRYTEQTIKQNLFWAFIYNVIAIPIAAIGLLKPTFGAAIMALSDVVLILNSLRLRVRNLE